MNKPPANYLLIIHLVWTNGASDLEIDILTKEWSHPAPPHAADLWLLIRTEFVYLERTITGHRLTKHIAHIRNRETGEEVVPYATA